MSRVYGVIHVTVEVYVIHVTGGGVIHVMGGGVRGRELICVTGGGCLFPGCPVFQKKQRQSFVLTH